MFDIDTLSVFSILRDRLFISKMLISNGRDVLFKCLWLPFGFLLLLTMLMSKDGFWMAIEFTTGTCFSIIVLYFNPERLMLLMARLCMSIPLFSLLFTLSLISISCNIINSFALSSLI